MSFPPPPGLQNSSLPARPPPSANAASQSRGNAFTAFQPRAVAAASQPYRTSSPVVSAPPTSATGYATPTTTTAAGYGGYYAQQQQRQQQQPHTYQSGPSYYGQAQYNDQGYGQYGMRGGRNYGRNESSSGLDPETEAQIAQWQSAYVNTDEMSAANVPAGRAGGPGRLDTNVPGTGGASTAGATPSTGSTPVAGPTPTATGPGRQDSSQKTVVRSGGGQTWTDSTLLEWDPAHFRLFVGNLAGEVTDDSLFKAFGQFPSVQKARVIRDKRTQKSKGYGFISFSDGDDYFKAAREMQGKYIGSHPILLRRAQTEVRPASANALKSGKKHGSGGGGGNGGYGGGGGSGARQGLGKVKQDGVKKSKTKGGLKLLG